MIRILSIVVLFFVGAESSYKVNREEAKAAFEYLNKVRLDPGKYSEEIGVKLDDVNPVPLLRWNDTLARVAEAKALDMGTRNYFAHVDPDGNGINIKMSEAGYTLDPAFLDKKSSNYFESISANSDGGVASIKVLIKDKGVNPPGHRNHLLGINSFWSNCHDIGIGYAEGSGSDYASYVCIIIAKHGW